MSWQTKQNTLGLEDKRKTNLIYLIYLDDTCFLVYLTFMTFMMGENIRDKYGTI
jgi:hypothetical protein